MDFAATVFPLPELLRRIDALASLPEPELAPALWAELTAAPRRPPKRRRPEAVERCARMTPMRCARDRKT